MTATSTAATDAVKLYIEELGAKARAATAELAGASTDQKNKALVSAASALRKAAHPLEEANRKDVLAARSDGKPESFIDRLLLDQNRIEAMAKALEDIAKLDDPVGRILAQFDRPNGLKIDRIAVPIGVIAMVYESRPNVGADAGALCLKSGNAVILRGGSESRHSTDVIVAAMRQGLKAAGLPENAIQTVETTDRSAVKHLLQAGDFIDLVIPRGGKGLVSLVKNEARVPTLLHLDGNCHSYVHESADISKAVALIKNAKLRRTGVCGATESVVVDQSIAADLIPPLVLALEGCEVRGDKAAQDISDKIIPALDTDWGEEYLDAIISIKVVQNVSEAISHIQHYSSGHTDAIIAEDQAAVRQFQRAIDSAIVMHNASTQFADGGEFGMGAEIGIATGKMHARGPVGLEQLTSFKYLVHGSGQIRP